MGATSEIRYVYMCMVSGLGCGKALVGTRTAISVLLAQMHGLRNKLSHLVEPPFPAFMVDFSATLDSRFPRALVERLLIGGMVTVICLLRIAGITSENSFEPNSLKDMNIYFFGYIESFANRVRVQEWLVYS